MIFFLIFNININIQHPVQMTWSIHYISSEEGVQKYPKIRYVIYGRSPRWKARWWKESNGYSFKRYVVGAILFIVQSISSSIYFLVHSPNYFLDCLFCIPFLYFLHFAFQKFSICFIMVSIQSYFLPRKRWCQCFNYEVEKLDLENWIDCI